MISVLLSAINGFGSCHKCMYAQFRHHLQKLPSELDVGHTRDPRKSGGFSLGKLFRKKKQRSYSEPGMHPEEEAVRRKQKVHYENTPM